MDFTELTDDLQTSEPFALKKKTEIASPSAKLRGSTMTTSSSTALTKASTIDRIQVAVIGGRGVIASHSSY